MATKKKTTTKKYESSDGKKFSTHAEAAAHNTKIGTNPSTKKTSSGGGSSSNSTPTPTPAPAPSLNISSTLKKGSKGSEVAALQKALGITADGIFGPQTEAAVKQYQASKGLSADGIVGPNTRASFTSGSSSGGSSNSNAEAPRTQHVVQEGDRVNPFTGKALTAAERVPGTILEDPRGLEGLPEEQPLPEQQVTPEVENVDEPLTPVTEPQPAAPAEDPALGANQQQPGQVVPGSTYTGGSIVDYLKSIGQPNDFAYRRTLAQQNGIENYSGTAQQNIELLAALRQANGPGNAAAGAGAAAAGAAAGQGNTVVTPDGAVTTVDTPEKSQFQQDIEEIMREFGIEPPDNLQSPQSSFSNTYKDVFENLGGQELKEQYEMFSKEFSDLQEEKNQKVQNIKNDPWLTEGVKVRRLRELDSEYEGRESNAIDKIKLAEGLFDDLRQDAQFITGGIMDQYNRSQDLTTELIMKAIDIAESRAQAEAKLIGQSPNDIYGTGIIGEYNFALANGYKGSFTQYQNEDANRKQKAAGGGSGGLGGMFSAAQISSTINQIAGAFDNEPIVKNFNILDEGYRFAQSLSNKTTNPSDDQGLIYAFAKAMDPGSVVREGEYATVQKYAQSWINSFGSSVEQAIAGTGFLTPTARQNIKKTIEARYNVSKKSYDNVFNSYQKRIEDARSGKGNTLTNYAPQQSVPFSQETIAPAPQDPPKTKKFLQKVGNWLFGSD